MTKRRPKENSTSGIVLEMAKQQKTTPVPEGSSVIGAMIDAGLPVGGVMLIEGHGNCERLPGNRWKLTNDPVNS